MRVTMDTVRPRFPFRRWLAAGALACVAAWGLAARAQEPARPVDVDPHFGRVELPARPVLLPKRQAPLFGLSSAVVRTEGETERTRGLMLRLLGQAGADGVRVERLQVGADWRVVGYPFSDRASAERTALALLKGGLRTEVVQF